MRIAIIAAASLMGMSGSVAAADLGAGDLPKIHSEYKANQARWADEFKGKTFEATLAVEKISDLFSEGEYLVSFTEKESDWTAGVECRHVQPSVFLKKANSGDQMRVYGRVVDHSFGAVDLEDCRFGDPSADLGAAIDAERADAQRAMAEQAAVRAKADAESEARFVAAPPAPTPMMPFPPTFDDIRRGGVQCVTMVAGPVQLRMGDRTPVSHVVCDGGRYSSWADYRNGAWVLETLPTGGGNSASAADPECEAMRKGLFVSAAAAAHARARCR
jgi:hypothetical protein